jgi:hypothetical protein
VNGTCRMSRFFDARRGFLTREAGGGGGDEGNEVKGSVEESNGKFVVGDRGHLAGFGGG